METRTKPQKSKKLGGWEPPSYPNLAKTQPMHKKAVRSGPLGCPAALSLSASRLMSLSSFSQHRDARFLLSPQFMAAGQLKNVTLPPTNVEVQKGPFQEEGSLSTNFVHQTMLAGGRGGYPKWVARSGNGLPRTKTCGPIPGFILTHTPIRSLQPKAPVGLILKPAAWHTSKSGAGRWPASHGMERISPHGSGKTETRDSRNPKDKASFHEHCPFWENRWPLAME